MHIIDGTKLGSKSKQKMVAGIKPLLQTLQPILDDRFALIHTLTVPGRREVVDALLVGPHGALVLKVDASPGRLRCIGDNWYAWDKKVKDLVPTEHNPTRDLKQGLRLIEASLVSQGLGTSVPMDGAVVFTDPKLTLEHMEPPVRLIDFKALPAWATQLAGTPAYLEKRNIEQVLGIFGAHVSVASTAPVPAPEPQAAPPPSPRARRGPFGLKLKRWQLYVLIGMAVVYLLVLIAGLYILLAPAA